MIKFHDRYISKEGLIYKIKNNKLVLSKIQKNHRGYLTVYANKKMYQVHRLVWEAFNGPIPEGYTIDHIDTDRTNNKLNNLRCCTLKENVNNPISRKKFLNIVKGNDFRNKVSNTLKDYYKKNPQRLKELSETTTQQMTGQRYGSKDFGDKYFEHFGIYCTEDRKLYQRERRYYKKFGFCSWEK